MVTIGGGALLDVAPPKARRSPALVARLRVLETGSPEAVVEEHLRQLGAAGARLPELRARTPLGPEALRAALATVAAEGRVFVADRETYVHAQAVERLRAEARAALAAYHAREPLRPGMSKEELRTRLGGVDERVFLAFLERFAQAGDLVVDRDKVRLGHHQVRLDPRQQEAVGRLEEEFRQAGTTPPTLDEAFARLGLERPDDQALAQVLVDERRLVRVREGLYFHAETLAGIQARVVEFLQGHEAISPPELKDLLGVTRKYAIPLLEYLDALRVTVRVGDRRILRETPGRGAPPPPALD
jgi:selenocysteine-specific elongation factor